MVVGMGLYLCGATLNQAALARGRAAQAAGVLARAAAGVRRRAGAADRCDDKVLQLEIAYLAGALVLCATLYGLYRRVARAVRNIRRIEQTHYRTCPLCEATCGLEVDARRRRRRSGRSAATTRTSSATASSARRARGSKALHEDPDRLRRPLMRDGAASSSRRAGTRRSSAIDELLAPILAEHGRDAVAAYLGNPSAHTLGAADLRARARCGRSARRTSSRRAPSTRCRSTSRPG